MRTVPLPLGKCAQIAALTANKAQLTACEKDKIRTERLKYNIAGTHGNGAVYLGREQRHALESIFWHRHACEKDKIRTERLKYNIARQGVRAYVMNADATKLSDMFSFDKILLDAPDLVQSTFNILDIALKCIDAHSNASRHRKSARYIPRRSLAVSLSFQYLYYIPMIRL